MSQISENIKIRQLSLDISWRDYIAIARPDHWIKHIFLVPGVVLAMILGVNPKFEFWVICAGFTVAALISSANYVINEWLDAEFDAHHPVKSSRPAVSKKLSPKIIWAEYIVLSAMGLATAYAVSIPLLIVAFLFLVSGWSYNLKPVRTKDKAYLDVASEALNNPIRLLIGWVIVDMTTLPPSSLLLAYWAGGAFLMSTKRLAEYRNVTITAGVEALHLYRSSFRGYSENSLLLQSFLYAQIACFFIAVFLVKYRIEYIFSFPLFALLFTVYLRIGLKQGSAAQTPEKLLKEKVLSITVIVLIAVLVLLSYMDLPWLRFLSEPYLIKLF